MLQFAILAELRGWPLKGQKQLKFSFWFVLSPSTNYSIFSPVKIENMPVNFLKKMPVNIFSAREHFLKIAR